MRRWVWGVVGGCCGLGLWWAVVEVSGAGQDAWWAVTGRVPAVMAGMAAVDRLLGRLPGRRPGRSPGWRPGRRSRR